MIAHSTPRLRALVCLMAGLVPVEAATANGRESTTHPGLKVVTESLVGGGGGAQQGGPVVHAVEMTSFQYLPAQSPEAALSHAGGFIGQLAPPPSVQEGVEILGVTRVGDSEIEIAWASRPSTRYTVASSPSLPAANWTSLATVLAAGTVSTARIPIEASPRFFRIGRLP